MFPGMQGHGPVAVQESADGKTSVEQQKMMEVGKQLADSKYKKYLEGVKREDGPDIPAVTDPQMRATVAICMENSDRFFQYKQETTQTGNVASFDKYAFPMIRAILPQLVATEIVSVQPMMGPTSQIFYLDFVAGTTKGSTSAGDEFYESSGAQKTYTSEEVDIEQVATGDGTTGTFSGDLSFTPIKPGTVTIEDPNGGQTLTDDGNGNLTGDGSGTITYDNGSVSVDFTSSVGSGDAINANYEYDMETNRDLPEMDLSLTSAPVQAQQRKLRSKWSMESAYNLRNLHGVEAEVELTSAVSNEIRYEIDREIIDSLLAIAQDASQFGDVEKFDKATPQYYSYSEHIRTLVSKTFNPARSRIQKESGRAIGNFIVAGKEVADVIEALPKFDGVSVQLARGAHYMGDLGTNFRVYRDPGMDDKQWLMGYKGDSFLQAGYVYAPYVPLYTTGLVQLDDFVNRMGMASLYGKKAVNGTFYLKGNIEDTS